MSNESEGKCPVMHGSITTNNYSGTTNKNTENRLVGQIY